MKQNNFQLAAKRAFVGDLAYRPRADVGELAQILWAHIDNPNTPDAEREAAQLAVEKCSVVLKFMNDPRKQIRVVPVGFAVRDFYVVGVQNLLERLPQWVWDEFGTKAYAQMATTLAPLVDNQTYSTDFRLENLEVLQETIRRLEEIASDDEEDLE